MKSLLCAGWKAFRGPSSCASCKGRFKLGSRWVCDTVKGSTSTLLYAGRASSSPCSSSAAKARWPSSSSSSSTFIPGVSRTRPSTTSMLPAAAARPHEDPP
eukprot:scaffold323_cov414-Prasinococcus_capsulatus_cf.AAC.41